MKPDSNEKPVVIWIDDFVARRKTVDEEMLRMIEEKADNRFEILLFESSDDAIPFVIDSAHRVFMFVQDSNRESGVVIPAWKKLRKRPGPSIGLGAHPGDFYTYVIDAYTPQAGTVFSGFSFSSDEEALITAWGLKDSRIVLADKMKFFFFEDSNGVSPFIRIASSQLDRWSSEIQTISSSEEIKVVAPLSEEMVVLCGAKPERIDSLNPRQFEELIASLFRNHGFDVDLTAATRDGGYDIVAAAHSGLKKETVLIEVKHFAPHRPVGVGIVRSLYGVKALNKASRAVLVTSSYVSQYAKNEFSRAIPWELDFVERQRLLDWCRMYVDELLCDDGGNEQNTTADMVKQRC
ncbi:MAG: restriction endonuclease [bacterium]|nr:restriction endonuclease [bacterium]